jgi:hypothetical protein
VIQQGHVFKLKTKDADGKPLWAYRYRLEGRGSARPQVGGFASREEAQKALRKALDRVAPGGGGATMTLGELVDEYLKMHEAAPVTIAKLRWLLGKATAVLGGKRIADLSPVDVYAWRLSVPEGHRFEATQALRQVLNRAVDWGLIDFNPAKRGIRNRPRRAREKRPFDICQQVEAVAAQGSVRSTGRWSSSPPRQGSGRRSSSDLTPRRRPEHRRRPCPAPASRRWAPTRTLGRTSGRSPGGRAGAGSQPR